MLAKSDKMFTDSEKAGHIMKYQQSEIGAVLESLCQQKGWSPSQLSIAAGLGKNTVGSLIEGGIRNPRKSTLEKLASALGVDIAILTGKPSASHLGTLIAFDLADEQLKEKFPNDINNLILDLAKQSSGERKHFLTKTAIPSLGISKGALVLINAVPAPSSGDIVVTEKDGSTDICYWVEPYLVCLGNEGEIHHFLNDQSVKILGKIEFTGLGKV